MPASGGIKLADANIWLALTFSDHAHHAKAKRWFDVQTDGTCAFCRVTQMALLRHLTNPKIMGQFVQTQQNASKNYDHLTRDPRVVFLNEPSGLETGFRSLSNSGSPAHGLWTDAYLASFAIETHLGFATFDKGFSRFAGLNLLVLS